MTPIATSVGWTTRGDCTLERPAARGRQDWPRLRRRWLDLEEETLVVADTRVVVDGRAADSDGKTAAARRTLSLDDFTVKYLRAHLELIDAERAAFGTTYPDHDFIAVRPDGVRLHPDTLTRRFNRLVDRAGVPRIRLHDVRHTYATLAMDAGVDPKMLSDRLGHANTSITLQIYAHRSVGKDRDLASIKANSARGFGQQSMRQHETNPHGWHPSDRW